MESGGKKWNLYNRLRLCEILLSIKETCNESVLRVLTTFLTSAKDEQLWGKTVFYFLSYFCCHNGIRVRPILTVPCSMLCLVPIQLLQLFRPFRFEYFKCEIDQELLRFTGLKPEVVWTLFAFYLAEFTTSSCWNSFRSTHDTVIHMIKLELQMNTSPRGPTTVRTWIGFWLFLKN